MSSPMFPCFRQRFIHESAWATEAVPAEPGAGSSAQLLVKMAGAGPGRGLGLVRPLLLDLDVLAREEGPPSESVLKRQKFAVFEKQCTKVAEGLYVSGEAVARDRSLLAAHAISHVVNCVGALYPEYWAADGIAYKTLWLQDHPQEDITCVLYDTFDFIEAARKGLCSSSGGGGGGGLNGTSSAAGLCQQPQQAQQQQAQQAQQLPALQQQQPLGGCAVAPGGRVLVHCSQGVSRSTSIAIAYLMWKTGGSYEEVYTAVRSLRGVTSPNVGFMCQLINWAKRRSRPPSRLRVYRMAPHCADAPGYVVAKPVAPRAGAECPDWSCLDTRGCFLLQLPRRLLVWRGARCGGALADAGLRAAGALVRYEGAPPPDVVQQGEEPDELLAALAPSAGCSSSSGANSGGMSLEPSAGSLPGAGGGSGAAAGQEDAASAPAGSQQQPCQQPAGGALCSNGRRQQSQQAAEGDSSEAAAAASALLTGMQLCSGLLGVVGEVDEYSSDYALLQQALLRGSRAGGGEAAGGGRVTPRGCQAADCPGAAAAAAAGGDGGGCGSSGASTPGRSDSPVSSEGRCRKHRRSSGERCMLGRQPGRMSAAASSSSADGGASGAPTAASASQGEPKFSRLDFALQQQL